MRRPLLTRTVAVAVFALGSAGLTVGASGPVAAGPDRGGDTRTDPGAAQVARIAVEHDRSPAEVRALLADPAVQVGADDRLYYADPARPGASTAAGQLRDERRTTGPSARRTHHPGPATELPPADLPDVFALHSRPGARKVIHLDFDGHDLSSSQWVRRERWPRGHYPAYSLDDDRTAFSAAERAAIHEIWERVAADYAPFDVDVTTEDPGSAALLRTSPGDTTYGMRVLVTDASADRVLSQAAHRLCNGCAGLAWLDVFAEVDAGRYQPALIFADQLQHDTWQVAETISHEVGHTLGLVHDGDATSSYHLGTAPWSPIMGAGAAGLSQWSRGEYAGARNHDTRGRRMPLQDDLAVIAAKTGTVPRDHGDTPAAATALASTATVSVTGSITRPDDRDVFRLDRTCAAPTTVLAEPTAVGTNLDVRLRVLDARGRVLRDENPVATGRLWSATVTGLDARTTLPGARGTTYLEVSGGSQGHPATGWSSYGSLGAYRLTVHTCADPVGPSGPVTPPRDTGTTLPPPPRAQPPLRPRRIQVARGARGGPASIVVRWSRAQARGARVTAYVLQARKVMGGRVVARRQGRVRPAVRRVEWRLGRGVWRVRVLARSSAGASPATPWSVRVRAR